MQVYFETLQVRRDGTILVYLHHPQRMLICDLHHIRQKANESAGDNFSIQQYGEYRLLQPHSDSKMAIFLECQLAESLTRGDGLGFGGFGGFGAQADDFILSRQEFNRIIQTATSILALDRRQLA